ncbi:glutathione S-transferase [Pseudooceanicola antarcticus]|uniref:Glutathione S-transferase n=1 Tax=Pseudooceanicola antarcticus TaxID=1247613 RepID=A0A285J5S4_9RHOB|nr:glutathione S-transferase family protein [Pseudooceanicola antarcticus]PJE29771.1 glutathione S-transferase family protein [Pseudooceanicola antarcticus]SNY54451.1 glutathione S-transferase [Pseudooceanicola antarcticus]
MITLHHCAGSRSMRVLWLLNELGEPFDISIRPFDASLRQPDYLVASPAGRVPALELEGETYFESLAIMEILCERFPARGLGRLPGDLDRPDWLVWLHFAETISQHCAALTQQHIVLFEDWQRSPTVMKIEVARLKKCFAAIEGRLSTPLENRDYLLTSGFSAADIAVGQAIWMALHYTDLEGFPETAAWYERITERPGFRDALPEPGTGVFAREFYAQPAEAPPVG